MFEWGFIAILAALPLPFLVRYIIPKATASQGAALRVPFFAELTAPSTATWHTTSTRPIWQRLLAYLAWIGLVLACAQPQWVGDPIKLPQTGRDLLLAIDISGSMQEMDMDFGGRTVSRLVAVKAVGGEFIKRREGDRLGLILFGEQAYLHVPLTFDRNTVQTMLSEAEIGLAGKGTAIGDAIGVAVKRMRAEQTKDRVLILMTDGANTAGQTKPLDAAKLAAEQGLKVYTIGIGSDPSLSARGGFFFGRMTRSDLDEPTMKSIAETTGGRYFRARDPDELIKIYSTLDKLEPALRDEKTFRPTTALYTWPLAAALFCSVLLGIYRLARSNLAGATR
jgi:Ca-activated chloride channel homolog